MLDDIAAAAHRGHPRERDNTRLLALSDGVFAVAITLLVLDLRVPDPASVPNGQLGAKVLDQAPHFFIYVVSFLVIGTFWNAHHRLFHLLRTHDAGVAWLNLLFLLCVTFLPYPTKLLAQYHGSAFAVIFYALGMAVCSAFLNAIWVYASGLRRLRHAYVSAATHRLVMMRGFLSTAIFLISAPIALLNTTAAQYLWLLVFVAWRLLARFHREAR